MKKILIVIPIAVCLLFTACDYYVPAKDHQVLQRDFQAQLDINNQLKEEMRGLKTEMEQLRANLEQAQDELEQTKDVLAWTQSNPPETETVAEEDEPDETQAAADATREGANAQAGPQTPAVSLPPAKPVSAEEQKKFGEIASTIR